MNLLYSNSLQYDMLPWEPDVQLILCVHCRSDNSTGGRHPGLIGALPEGSKTQPKQCLQRETSRQITVRILELGLGGSLGGTGEGGGVEGGREGWGEGIAELDIRIVLWDQIF